MMRLYLKSLINHPGLFLAISITAMFLLAAAKNGEPGAYYFALILSIVFPWMPVFVSAWGMRNQYKAK